MEKFVYLLFSSTLPPFILNLKVGAFVVVDTVLKNNATECYLPGTIHITLWTVVDIYDIITIHTFKYNTRSVSITCKRKMNAKKKGFNVKLLKCIFFLLLSVQSWAESQIFVTSLQVLTTNWNHSHLLRVRSITTTNSCENSI